MTQRVVAEDGVLRLGDVTLPAGKRAHALETTAGPDGTAATMQIPVAWVTTEPVPDSGRAWEELAQLAGRTGQVPFLAKNLRADSGRPWDAGIDFHRWKNAADASQLDPADILREKWPGAALAPEELDDAETREWITARLAPFSWRFPGLAPRVGGEPLSSAERWRALDCLPPARVGLVPAGEPGGMLSAIGWHPANWIDGQLAVNAVLRSWEDRFGARLLEIGLAEFKVLADRPPRTLIQAQRLAAEHVAFADECFYGTDETAQNEVAAIAERLVNQPIWGFWWD
jgi:hypothetical protein